MCSSTTQPPFFQMRSCCLVNHLHLLFIHPAPVHFDCGEGAVDLTDILGGQLNIDGSQVFVQVIDVACARNRHDERLSGKQPGHGSLNHLSVSARGVDEFSCDPVRCPVP